MTFIRRFPITARACIGAACALLGLISAGPARAADTTTTTTSSSATAIRKSLGEAPTLNAPGQTLYLQQVTIPPGVTLAEHSHQGTQVARVTKGVLTYQILSGAAQVTRRDGSSEMVTGPATVRLRAGESLVEVQSLAHTGANRGKRPVVIELAALLQTGAPLATPLGTATGGSATTVKVDLVSQESRLGTAGASGAATYGWNRLTGTAQDPRGAVAVELLGSVAYTNGSGPFSGFVTFTYPDGAVLVTQMQGVATRATDTGVTTFAATVGVFNGTGRFVDATGSGTFTGSRAAALGQPVAATFVLDVTTK